MEFIAILLGTLLAVFIILLLILLFVYLKLKRTMNDVGISTNQVKELIKESEYNDKYRQKQVTGMTNLLVPHIRKDYSNFNEEEFYNKVETSLLAIFNSLTKESISKTNELNLIRDKINEEIQNNISSNIKETYKDVKFHKHAIKDYKHENGCLSITVGSSLEYYYEKYQNGKIVGNKKDYKEQVVYITKYVHIYDPDKYVTNKNYLSAHCPNCGAPLKNFGDNHCTYCSSNVEPINLKSWFISEYKIDKR